MQQNHAFTMIEMMVVVAVLTILFSIAILSISSLSTTLRMTELDAHAKTIFLEAQNQLAAVEVAGGAPRFYDKMREDYEPRFLNEKPSDYDETLLKEEQKEDWKNLCYVFKDDQIAKEYLILEQSMAYQLGGNYIIELNPQTGDVYGVFYWENAELLTYENVIEKVGNRTLADRTKTFIGYYGGQVATTEPSKVSLGLEADIINEEELYIKISLEKSSRLLRYYRSGALKLICTVMDESGHTWIASSDKTYEGTDFIIDVSKAIENIDGLEFYVLLDSVEEGFGISDITIDKQSNSGTSLTPGENLSVKVDCEFKQGAYYCTETDTGNSTNSIFYNKNIVDNRVIYEINTVRHLLNLNKYVHNSVNGNEIVINQTNDIDYTNKNFAWKEGRYVGKGVINPFIITENPMVYETIKPIRNDNLFINSGGTDITIINGDPTSNGGYEIRNFWIKADEDNAGLFALAENVQFKNLRLEDFSVNADGQKNVGALTGTITGGSVENCGVYLTTYQMNDKGVKDYFAMQVNEEDDYPNEMSRRYDTYKIAGNENVGGLVGAVDNVFIKDCFSAVKVEGNTDVGGFIGYASNIKSAVDDNQQPINGIWNCYSSGSVVGKAKDAGGFVGYASDIDVENAYSTSNIYGKDTFAGFAGYANASRFVNCNVYGEILDSTGTIQNLNHVDGFANVGRATNNEYINCAYLKQTAYNASNELGALVPAKSYADFIASSENKVSIGSSYPYNAALLYKVFPFESVIDSHYGDWPVQYSMNTSIVYYEKYKNSDGSYTYGFYCESKLTSKEETDIVNDYIWVLDTLQDRECVEDGYALLSTHNLEQFNYEVYVGSDDVLDYQNTLRVGFAGEESASTAIYLAQQGALSFSAFETQRDNYDGVEPEDTYIVTGMYLYQLPYELQNTDRYNVDGFYDKLVVYAGYARGNADVGTSTPVLGGKTKEEGNVEFYYCPHFARTAMNPGVGSIDLSNPQKVYVRSARQLNNLGRFPYYWNDKGGAAAMIFEQETDVNFGTYTKNYCGREGYDLMNTSAKVMMNGAEVSVANKPIGEADGENSYAQFTNDYDGQYHRIIDYCVESDAQFVGLFGEITSASLQNIVMTVSKRNAGVIKANYLDTGRSFEINRAGVGALVGLSYKDNVIHNCAAVGYDIQYHQYPESNGMEIPTGIAVGGLIGFCNTDISNCSADNNVMFVAHCDYGEDEAIFLGGLAGSFWYSTMENCYAGGYIDVDDFDESINKKYTLIRLRIGGVCPGFLNNGQSNDSTAGSTYKNVYSYARISDRVWEVEDFEHLMPSISRMKVIKKYQLFQGYRTSTQAEKNVDAPKGYLSGYLGELYEVYLANQEKDSDVWAYFTDDDYPKMCDPVNYDGLASIGLTEYKGQDISQNNPYLDDSLNYENSVLQGKGLDALSKRAIYSYPLDANLAGQKFPFPEFNYRLVTDANGNQIREYIHYGDWVVDNFEDDEEPEVPEEDGYILNPGAVNVTDLNNPPLDNKHRGDRYSYYGGIFYYEIYEDNRIGIYATGTVYAENSSQKGLIQTLSSTKTPIKRGIGVFHYGESYNISNGQYSVSREGGDTWDVSSSITDNRFVLFTAFSENELVIRESGLYPGYKFYSVYETDAQGSLEEILSDLGYEDDAYTATLGTGGGPAHQSTHEITIQEIENSRQ